MSDSDDIYKTLFQIFEQVFNFWQGTSDNANVEIMFRSAKILENSYKELLKTVAIEAFEVKLKEFCDLKGIKRVPLEFFSKASHHILSRYITDSTFNDSVVNFAVCKFINDNSEEDFHELVQKLANTNQTVEYLSKTVCSKDIDQVKANYLLEELRKTLTHSNGDAEEIYSDMSNSISNDVSTYQIYLKVLCLQNESEIALQIQEVIAISLSKIMRDSSNNNFYSYFLDLNVQDFETIITKWPSFLESFLQTVGVSVKSLQCVYSGETFTWTNKGMDTCLSFDQIVVLFNRCRNLPGISDKIKEYLKNLGEEGITLLAEDIVLKSQLR